MLKHFFRNTWHEANLCMHVCVRTRRGCRQPGTGFLRPSHCRFCCHWPEGRPNLGWINLRTGLRLEKKKKVVYNIETLWKNQLGRRSYSLSISRVGRTSLLFLHDSMQVNQYFISSFVFSFTISWFRNASSCFSETTLTVSSYYK